MTNSIGATVLFVLAAAASALAQDAGVQQAVRWERAKDAAAVRQARLEPSNSGKPAEAGKPAEGSKAVAESGSAKAEAAPEAAVRWERAKDRPETQQRETTAAAKPKKK